MKALLDPALLPADALLLTCSSHEDRCLAIPRRWGYWRPRHVLLFHYDDANPRREKNHAELLRLYDASSRVVEIPFTEGRAVDSFRRSRRQIIDALEEFRSKSILLDVSVFTRRHLLMLLQWLDDAGLWKNLWVLYSEPEDYEVSSYVPLSFGVSQVEEVPGFSAAPDASRPLHVVIFLGYEGDRALATYEIIQPKITTLVIPDPPFREEWRGRTEDYNKDLISIVGSSALKRADALDPQSTLDLLRQVLGPEDERQEFSKIICPLGTKPQAIGAYIYARQALDAPALLYTGPLRHNHSYFSHGIGSTWILKDRHETVSH